MAVKIFKKKENNTIFLRIKFPIWVLKLYIFRYFICFFKCSIVIERMKEKFKKKKKLSKFRYTRRDEQKSQHPLVFQGEETFVSVRRNRLKRVDRG